MVLLDYMILRSKGVKPALYAARGSFHRREGHYPDDVEIIEDSLDASARARLRADASVLAIAPNMRLAPTAVRNPDADSQAVASNWGIEALRADSSPFDGSGIRVGLIDTGTQISHPAFSGVSFHCRNFTAGAIDDVNDVDGRGTHAAGITFGRDISGQRIGVARGITSACIAKVTGRGGGGTTDAAHALKWCADQHAHIIALSLALDFPTHVVWLQEQFQLPAAVATRLALEGYRQNLDLFSQLCGFISGNNSYERSSLIISATGDDSSRPDYELAGSSLSTGAGLAVGAIALRDNHYRIAEFANAECDVVGPGKAILSAATDGGLCAHSSTACAVSHTTGIATLWGQRMIELHQQFDARLLARDLIASARVDGFHGNADGEDIGAGLIQAPQA